MCLQDQKGDLFKTDGGFLCSVVNNVNSMAIIWVTSSSDTKTQEFIIPSALEPTKKKVSMATLVCQRKGKLILVRQQLQSSQPVVRTENTNPPLSGSHISNSDSNGLSIALKKRKKILCKVPCFSICLLTSLKHQNHFGHWLDQNLNISTRGIRR